MASSGSGGFAPPGGPRANQLPPAVLASTHRGYQIDKLTGPNFLVWRVRMEILLL